MSLLPDGASFAERVQDCFLAFRGSGLMLSALDVELLEEWATQQVPFEVVARGIRRAAELSLWDGRPGESALRSLRACRRQVEAEIKKHRGTSLGRAQASDATAAVAPAHLRRHEKLLSALRKVRREHPELDSALHRLEQGALHRAPLEIEDAARQEEWVYLALIRGLPFATRLALLREARQLSQNALPISARARKMGQRFHRAAVLRRQLGLPSFW